MVSLVMENFVPKTLKLMNVTQENMTARKMQFALINVMDIHVRVMMVSLIEIQQNRAEIVKVWFHLMVAVKSLQYLHRLQMSQMIN